MVSSTLLSLIVVPTVFIFIEKTRRWLNAKTIKISGYEGVD
jgi:hypothetical protein